MTIDWKDNNRGGARAVVGDLELYVHRIPKARRYFVSLNSEHSSFDDQVLTSTYARSIPTAKVAAERMAREWVRRQCEAFGMEVKDGD